MRAAIHRFQRHSAWLAPLLWVGALAAAGAALDGYSQLRHPAALPGGAGVPGAAVFNLLGFVVPGLLVAVSAVALRARLEGAHAARRIGARLLLLSGLAFALQGVLPLDPSDLDADASRRHAAAWVLWWVAALPAMALLAVRDRRPAIVLLVATALFAFAVLLGAAPLGQRVAVLGWFAAAAVAGRAGHRVSRGAA